MQIVIIIIGDSRYQTVLGDLGTVYLSCVLVYYRVPSAERYNEIEDL